MRELIQARLQKALEEGTDKKEDEEESEEIKAIKERQAALLRSTNGQVMDEKTRLHFEELQRIDQEAIIEGFSKKSGSKKSGQVAGNHRESMMSEVTLQIPKQTLNTHEQESSSDEEESNHQRQRGFSIAPQSPGIPEDQVRELILSEMHNLREELTQDFQ